MVLRIHDDNPASLDLLGFDAIAMPIVEAIRRPETRPLTVGIRGDWGSGKSTLLRFVGNALADGDQHTHLVLTIDPWEFENAGELRSTLVEMVLTELRDLVGDNEQVTTKLRRLIGRVRFGKIAQAAIKGAMTVPIDGGLGLVGQLVKGVVGGDLDSFVAPASSEKNAIPATMQGFRKEFDDLVEAIHNEIGVEKIVVLVDDLDRCLPDSVVESLEAIKLFLSVERMVFVLAADEALVRSAIAASLASSGRASDFADPYLDKIVQLPVTIPVLTFDDAVTYATLILCSSDPDKYDALRNYCADRRRANLLPLLDGASHDEQSAAHERLARQICDGLRADRKVNPRQIKRFLNGFAVRSSIAEARGIRLDPSVMAKLMLLEQKHMEHDFKVLAETPSADVRGLLARWEAWAGTADGSPPPDDLSEGSRHWAASEPLLAGVPDDVPAYLALAAALTAMSSGGRFSSRVAKVVDGLVAARSNEAARKIVLKQLAALDEAEAEQVMLGLAQQAPGLREPAFAAKAIIEVIDERVSLAAAGAKIIDDRLASALDRGTAARLVVSKHTALSGLADRLATDVRVPDVVRRAIHEAKTANI